MDRRFILASIATFAAAPLLVRTALAQNAPSPAPAPAAGSSQRPQLSTARQNHIRDTLSVGSLSLMLSRIAQPKVNAPRLKQFIEFEIAEQETIASIHFRCPKHRL